MFRKICLGFAVLTVLVLGWMVNDLRLELKRSATTLNGSLPEILANTRKSSETLARVSEDMRALRDLAGVSTETRDSSLVVYADGILDLVQESGGRIGTRKLIGSGLRNPTPAGEWTVGARKEALVLSFRARSRAELLERLCHSKFGSAWMVEFDDAEPVELLQWLIEHHAPTREVLDESE